MIPFIIAGAVGFGIAKLFEKDDNKKFAKGGQAGEDLENYSNYDEFYNVVFDYIKREENLTEEETKDICIVNESIIEAEFDGGSSPRFTGDVILGYLSNERAYKNYAGGGGIGIGRYSILAQHSNGEKPLVMKRVNNRNEIAGMVDKVELAFKKLGYNDVTIFVTDEETDDEVYNYAEGGEVVIYPTDSNGKTFKWINIDDKYQEVISDDISKKMGMVVRVLQGYDLFVLESETQNKKDYHILAQISTETGEIEMIKGKFNSEPSSKYQKYIDDLINKFNFSLNKDNYADGGGVGKYNTYKLRAEGLNDFMNFLGTGVYSNVKSYTVEPIGFPDVAVSFETNLSLSEIKAKLREVQDSHVMLDTIKPIKEYTGERYAGGGDVKSMSDEEIENEYNKILSVQILAGDIDEDEVEELSISEKREFLENYKDEYAKGGLAKKRRRSASIQYGRSDRSVDKTRFAKPVGYRYTDEKATQLNKKTYTKPTEAQVKKYLGNGIYKENRKNRSDKDRKVKL